MAWSTGGTLRGYLGANGAGGYVAIGPGYYWLGSAVGTTSAGIGYVAAAVTGAFGTTAGDGSLRAKYYETVVGANVASASTIAPTGGIFHVTGTTQITTISLPRTGFTGSIQIIPDAAFTTATGGNIALASTAVVGRVLTMTYDGTSWYPSY